MHSSQEYEVHILIKHITNKLYYIVIIIVNKNVYLEQNVVQSTFKLRQPFLETYKTECMYQKSCLNIFSSCLSPSISNSVSLKLVLIPLKSKMQSKTKMTLSM